MNCSQCGNPLAPNAKFCKNCGAKQAPVPEPAASPAPAADSAGRTCEHCQNLCKPNARFCPKCGTPFASEPSAASVATTPLEAAPLAAAVLVTPPLVSTFPEQSPVGMTPVPAAAEAATSAAQLNNATPINAAPVIEPFVSPVVSPVAPHSTPPAVLVSAVPAPAPSHAASDPVAPFLSPIGATNTSTPAFPPEPPQSSKAWIKWAALVLVIAAVGGGVLLAKNMKGLSGTSNTSSAPQTDKNGVSAEDKAKADTVVGPLGGSDNVQAPQPTQDTSIVNIGAPTAPSTTPATPAAGVEISQPTPLPTLPPPPEPLPPPKPVVIDGPSIGIAPSMPSNKPVPPSRPRPQNRNGSPSLDDLLD